MYKAEIIADSLSPQGDRLTTFVVQFPRIVLAEFNTHRMFSRNSASSRAIPFKKMVKMVEENPFIPIAWQKDHKGMQGTEYFTTPLMVQKAELHWLKVRDKAIQQANILNSFIKIDKNTTGVTKQLCNRLLEPFMWHKVIVTSSEEGLMNFFNLRCPQYTWEQENGCIVSKSKEDFLNEFLEVYPTNGEPELHDMELVDKHLSPNNHINWLKINKSQADIHIQVIAEMMWDCYNESTPEQLEVGEWHIPFGDKINQVKLDEIAVKHFGTDSAYFGIEGKEFIDNLMVKIATARCARISYNNFEGKDDYEANTDLYNSLVQRPYTNKKGIVFTKNDPIHASPAEHCAKAMSNSEYESYYKGKGANGGHTGKLENQGWCRNFKGFIQLRETLD